MHAAISADSGKTSKLQIVKSHSPDHPIVVCKCWF